MLLQVFASKTRLVFFASNVISIPASTATNIFHNKSSFKYYNSKDRICQGSNRKTTPKWREKTKTICVKFCAITNRRALLLTVFDALRQVLSPLFSLLIFLQKSVDIAHFLIYLYLKKRRKTPNFARRKKFVFLNKQVEKHSKISIIKFNRAIADVLFVIGRNYCNVGVICARKKQ